MGNIIIASSTSLVKLMKEVDDVDKFNYILVSHDIQTTGKLPNVKSMPTLIPTAQILGKFHQGETSRYKQLYVEFLNSRKNDTIITVIVKSVIEDNLNIVLVCSDTEAEMKFLKYIGKYIETLYGLESLSVKKFLKNKDSKAELNDEGKKMLEKKLSQLEEIDLLLLEKSEEEIIKERLEKMKRKELRDLCDENDIEYKEKDEKEKLVKRIFKFFKKRK